MEIIDPPDLFTSA